MKILIISPFLPYEMVPHAGGNYIFELIRGLSKEHEVHLVSRVEPEELKYAGEMKSLCENVLLYPFKTPKERSPTGVLRIIYSYFKLGRLARRYLNQHDFDIIQVEYVETAIMLGKLKGCTTLLDAHDIISKPAERRYRQARSPVSKLISSLIWSLIKWAEVRAANGFSLVITRSEMDRRYLMAMNSSVTVSVIPHPLKEAERGVRREASGPDILFAGAMNRKVNQDAVVFIIEKILPLVRADLPGVKLIIVGNKPPPSIIEYGERDKNIIITGFVDNIMQYYLDAVVMVTPLFVGGGIIAKNVDAMGAGLPVVTSRVGNEGISAIDGESVLIAESAREFSEKILKVLRDPVFAKQISDSGREFALKSFSPPVIMGLVEASFNKALSGEV